MGDKSREVFERLAERLAVAREWLRRVMPRVALAAVALYILRLFIRDTWLYRETPLGLVGMLTLLAVCSTIAYYALKFLVRVKRKLLWRVRRRLIITYLFIGVTPVVLLLILGALAATGGSSQAMVRVVTVQLNDSERQTLEGARSLADELSSLPAETNDRAAQVWLDERAALLRATLPGARVSAWRGAGDAESRLGEGAAAQLLSARVDDSTRGVGADDGDARETLPAWLEGREEWGGFAYLPPPKDSQSAYGTPSLRALVRRSTQGRAVAVLITVPVSRALVERFRESTGVGVHPYFIGAEPTVEDGGERRVEYDFGDARGVQNDRPAGTDAPASDSKGRATVVDFRHDQFGDTIPEISAFNFPYPVILNATDWTTGRESPRPAFVVDWSWAEGGKQFWSDAVLGETWWMVLYFTALAFLLLELLALVSAGWMTRAVTGTVHKLYRATESIKRGDFSHRIRTRSRDQLGELALAFNDMSADIETLLAERVERERLEREIEIAAEVQAQLFPRSVPILRTAQLAGECRAARGVAGDYYDFIEAAPDLVAVALGDVSGKGISASLVMSNLQAALRAQVSIVAERLRLAGRGAAATIQSGKPAAVAAVADGGLTEVSRAPLSGADADERGVVTRMAEHINEQLCRATDANRFATLFLALYDDRTRTLTYTNAGHNAPALVRSDGSIEKLSTGGTILGAFESARFDEGRVTLGDGDLLVIFSDGITEALDSAGEEYGEARLAAFAAARRAETVNNIRQSIFDEVDKWSGATERGDDQTLVILKAVMSDE
ncbi:MAG TPA: SpoIIE family protein phosphatase [Pyrinomonadaceae bacterium]|nr:SpoIIE family protein phosphatase [Pyrinomonadaceae bacterium]